MKETIRVLKCINGWAHAKAPLVYTIWPMMLFYLSVPRCGWCFLNLRFPLHGRMGMTVIGIFPHISVNILFFQNLPWYNSPRCRDLKAYQRIQHEGMYSRRIVNLHSLQINRPAMHPFGEYSPNPSCKVWQDMLTAQSTNDGPLRCHSWTLDKLGVPVWLWTPCYLEHQCSLYISVTKGVIFADLEEQSTCLKSLFDGNRKRNSIWNHITREYAAYMFLTPTTCTGESAKEYAAHDSALTFFALMF